MHPHSAETHENMAKNTFLGEIMDPHFPSDVVASRR